jgi:predicted nuclease with TOPRIM domain
MEAEMSAEEQLEAAAYAEMTTLQRLEKMRSRIEKSKSWAEKEYARLKQELDAITRTIELLKNPK